MYSDSKATLPATYIHVDGKYNMPMYAQSENNSLPFKNLCGVLAITVSDVDFASVSSIEVLSDQQMNGVFTSTADGVLTFASVTLTDALKKVTLYCNEEECPKTFYIPVPACIHNSLTIKVSDNAGKTKLMVTKKSGGVEVVRNTVYPIVFADNCSLPGVFTVKTAAGSEPANKVRFSRGNLYANKAGEVWKWNFYDKQYKYNSLSTGASRTALATEEEIDLFTWGYIATSSYDPIGKDFVSGHTDDKQLSPSEDWGSQIGNGNTWRTLSCDEWTCLLNQRTSSTVNGTANARYLKCKVNDGTKDVCGLMIFPDTFTWPTEAGSAPAGSYINDNDLAWTSVPGYTPTEFVALEKAGVVFLPAAGYRDGSDVSDVGVKGFYWSSTAVPTNFAYDVYFLSDNVYNDGNGQCYCGFSVRLVTEAADPAPATKGTATRNGDITVNWVQLWENGPKFAEYNVGATSAIEYGGYYCWGGNIDKDSQKDYKSGNDPLIGADDTATNLWGNNWRMPTSTELSNEAGGLLTECTCVWTTNYKDQNINGLLCTGKGAYAFNSVFLPAAGYYNSGTIDYESSEGIYWSSSPTPTGYNACYLDFRYGYHYITNNNRYFGFSVRAVLKE